MRVDDVKSTFEIVDLISEFRDSFFEDALVFNEVVLLAEQFADGRVVFDYLQFQLIDLVCCTPDQFRLDADCVAEQVDDRLCFLWCHVVPLVSD